MVVQAEGMMRVLGEYRKFLSDIGTPSQGDDEEVAAMIVADLRVEVGDEVLSNSDAFMP